MKLLFFINGIYLGGKERRLVELMKEIKSRYEFEFELAVMHSEINYQDIFDLKIKIHYLIRKSKNDLSVFRSLYKICRDNDFGIIHCWDSMTAIYAIPVCKLLKIKLVNGMVVDTPVRQNILNKNWFRARLTFPFSDIVIGNSNAGLKAYKAPAHKSLCIYNGMDLTRFDHLTDAMTVRQEIFGNDTHGIFIVGMVAAFEIRKDYKTLIKAASVLISKNENIRFLLLGGGELQNQIKAMVPAALATKILFLGKISKVESIINIFDIGVLLTNSNVHGEGVSNSLIEYMALGKPVIATRGGGTDEIVANNENGYLIDPFNEEQLIQKIEILIDNKNRNELGKKGNQMIRRKFNLSSATSRYIMVYQNLLKKN